MLITFLINLIEVTVKKLRKLQVKLIHRKIATMQKENTYLYYKQINNDHAINAYNKKIGRE